MPWLMALLRNSTFAGSTMIEASGSRPLVTRTFTPAPATRVSDVTIGPTPSRPMIAMMPPRMPRLKFATSISKPALTLLCSALSISLSR